MVPSWRRRSTLKTGSGSGAFVAPSFVVHAEDMEVTLEEVVEARWSAGEEEERGNSGGREQ